VLGPTPQALVALLHTKQAKAPLGVSGHGVLLLSGAAAPRRRPRIDSNMPGTIIEKLSNFYRKIIALLEDFDQARTYRTGCEFCQSISRLEVVREN
jgi:hypothetical protein